MRKFRKTSRRDSYNKVGEGDSYRHKEPITARWAGGTETWYRQDSHLQMRGNLQTRAQLQLQRTSSENKWSESHIGICSLGILQLEDRPPGYLVSKASGAYFQETQRTLRNRHSTPNGHSQNLTGSATQGTSRHLKGSWVWLTCCSWRASQRGRRRPELVLGIQTCGSSRLMGSNCHADTSAGKCHSEIPF